MKKPKQVNGPFNWTKDFIERTILLSKLFYKTIIQRENERNIWKMNDNFENERNNFFYEWLKKKNEIKKSQVSYSIIYEN